MSIKKKTEAGFSYIDVMIAVVILMVGILALMAAITTSVVQTKGQELQLNAKQIATSTMESIMSLKEAEDVNFGWDKIGNVGSNGGRGVFVTGFQDVLSDAGPDEVVGTADDTGTVITGFRRQIAITDICDPDRPSYNCPTPGPRPVMIRSVEVTVNYYVGGIQRQERLATILTNYSIE